jgi:hypothetical protein
VNNLAVWQMVRRSLKETGPMKHRYCQQLELIVR